MESDESEYAASDESSNSTSSDSGISQTSETNEEWNYSLFSDILITLHLGSAAVFLAHTIKNIILELYIPTLATFGSHANLFAALLDTLHTVFANLLRVEVIGSVLIIITSISIGREITNFRILRLLGRYLAYLLSRLVIYLVVIVHYYCIRIYLDTP